MRKDRRDGGLVSPQGTMAILPSKADIRERGKASCWKEGTAQGRGGKGPPTPVLTQASRGLWNLICPGLQHESHTLMASPDCDFMRRH